jgi:hypothetical protein
LKSVILQRKPEITFNGQFLDFARHYGFTSHPDLAPRAEPTRRDGSRG